MSAQDTDRDSAKTEATKKLKDERSLAAAQLPLVDAPPFSGGRGTAVKRLVRLGLMLGFVHTGTGCPETAVEVDPAAEAPAGDEKEAPKDLPAEETPADLPQGDSPK